MAGCGGGLRLHRHGHVAGVSGSRQQALKRIHSALHQACHQKQVKELAQSQSGAPEEEVPKEERSSEAGHESPPSETQTKPNSPIFLFVKSFGFQFAVNTMILLNAAQMGMAADVRGPTWDLAWDACEHFFTAFFTVELFIKSFALKLEYVQDRWNVFDIFIVGVSIFSAWIRPLISSTTGSTALGLVRMLRLLRLMRMLKVLKVIPDFIIIIDGMLGALRTMFWVSLLCLFLMYMWAVACVEIVGNDEEYPNYSMRTEDIMATEVIETFNNYQYFGTVRRSLLSLLNLVLFSELDTILRPLWEIQPFVVPILLLLVFIVTFGFLNVLVAMVVDTVMQSMARLKAQRDASERSTQMQFIDRLAELMFSMDSNYDGSISVDELASSCKIDELLDVLGLVHLPYGFGLEDLHRMLDVDGSGQLSKEEVVDGMFRLVFSSDFQRDCIVQFGLGVLKTEMYRFNVMRKEEHEELNRKVDTVLNELKILRAQPPSAATATRDCLQSSCAPSWCAEAPACEHSYEEEAVAHTDKPPLALPVPSSPNRSISPDPSVSAGDDAACLQVSVTRRPQLRPVPSAGSTIQVGSSAMSENLDQSPRAMAGSASAGCKSVLLPDDADADLPPSPQFDFGALEARLSASEEVMCLDV